MSSTKVVREDLKHIKDDHIRLAAHILRSGGLVIIPTETVYGVAADMLKSSAVDKLFQIKRRPKDKPFTIVIDKRERIEEFAVNIPLAAYKLANRFWPGPLTMILEGVNQPSVGLRMPDNEIALRVIAETKDPVVLPSANLSDNDPPVNFSEALKDFNGLVDLAIDGGPVKLGVESSIVDLRGKQIEYIRMGALGREEIERTANKKQVLFVCTGNSCRSVMAELYFRKILEERGRDDVEASSAGVMLLSGIHASQGTKEVLARECIDASMHISRRVSRMMLHQADLILVMGRSHEEAVLKMAPGLKNRIFLLKEFAKMNINDLEIPDPIGKSPEFYRHTFLVIKEALEKVIDLI
jgi:L-threonylcarbamoyladenylate synthase